MIPDNEWEQLLDAMVRDHRVDSTDLAEGPEICDAENLERLLRLQRRELRPAFSALRRGIENGFKVAEIPLPGGHRHGLRGHFNRWQASCPLPGNWYVLNSPEDVDLLEQEEVVKERVRRLVLASMRRGASVEFRVPPQDPHIPRYLGLFRSLLQRSSWQGHSIRLRSINGAPALRSPYMGPLLEFRFTRGYRELILRGSYR